MSSDTIDAEVDEMLMRLQEALMNAQERSATRPRSDGRCPPGMKLEPYMRLAEFPIDGLYVPGLPRRDAKKDISGLDHTYIT